MPSTHPSRGKQQDYAKLHGGIGTVPDENQLVVGRKRGSNATGSSKKKVAKKNAVAPLAARGSAGGQEEGNIDGGEPGSTQNPDQDFNIDAFIELEAERERSRLLEQRLDEQMVMIQQLQERSDRSRSRSPPDDSTQDEQDRGGNAGHDGPSSARKKREELSYEEHRIQSQLRRFVYFDRAFVPATILADIFLGEKGEEDQANVFDLLSEVFGTEDLDDLDIRKQYKFVRGRAFSEATQRVKECFTKITRISLNDAAENTAETQALLGPKGISFTFSDPLRRTGRLESSCITETISALIHGPLSIGKATAEARAHPKASSHFLEWSQDEISPVTRITPNLVAFATAQLFCHLRGFRQFKLNSNPSGKAYEIFTVYNETMEWFARKGQIGEEVLQHHSSLLIPKTQTPSQRAFDIASAYHTDSEEDDAGSDRGSRQTTPEGSGDELE